MPAALRTLEGKGRVRDEEDGRVTESRVAESSGQPSLDRAARQLVESMDFSPAAYGGEPTAVRVQQAIVFRPETSAG